MPGVIKKKSLSSKSKSKLSSSSSSSLSSKKQKVTHQQSISFQKEDKNIKFVDHDILLTDAIYGKNIPEEGKEKYFRYTVTANNLQYKTMSCLSISRTRTRVIGVRQTGRQRRLGLRSNC